MTALVLFNENFRNRSDEEILPLAADDEERPPDELCPEFEEEELPEAKTSIDVSADEISFPPTLAVALGSSNFPVDFGIKI